MYQFAPLTIPLSQKKTGEGESNLSLSTENLGSVVEKKT